MQYAAFLNKSTVYLNITFNFLSSLLQIQQYILLKYPNPLIFSKS